MYIFLVKLRLEEKYPAMIEAFSKQFQEFLNEFEVTKPLLFEEKKTKKECKIAVTLPDDVCLRMVDDKMVASIIYLLYFSKEKFEIDFTYINEDELLKVSPIHILSDFTDAGVYSSNFVHVRNLGHEKVELKGNANEPFWETFTETYEELKNTMRNRIVSTSSEIGIDEMNLFDEVHKIYIMRVLNAVMKEEEGK